MKSPLRVWLPLTKDSRNISIENIHIINNNVSLTNDGMFVKCHNFNGTSSFYQFDGLDIDESPKLSLAFWCNSANGNLHGVFVCRDTSNNHQISLTASGLGFRDSNHSSYTSFSFEQPSANVWTHYAIIYNRGIFIVYKNGNKIYENSFGDGRLRSSITNIRVGLYESSGGLIFFSGKLLDFRIYSEALTEKEVLNIYKNGMFNLVPYKRGSKEKGILFDKRGLCLMPLRNNGAYFTLDGLYFDGKSHLRPKKGNVGFNQASEGAISVWFS